ncbi:N-formylglutamate amidohydrolase [Myxococcota bacterium]|nr:N-formylglutamate amidohydrolase [Myxococcota bacterium]
MTCEHAASDLPEWSPREEDQVFLADHWGWDPGAADLTRALCDQLGGSAILSRFSRLVCDPNRDPSDPTFIVDQIEDHALSWNQGLDEVERERRRVQYHEPYHDAIHQVLKHRTAQNLPTRLLSMHSFTPVYRGEHRSVEIGVLFDDHELQAEALLKALIDNGLQAKPNEPYSGYAGLIHAARRHGRQHGIVYLELEIRQDLIATPDQVAKLSRLIGPAIEEYARDTERMGQKRTG